MGSRWIGMSALLLCAWAFGASIAGCSKKTTAPEPGERVNEDKPNANSRIRSQTIFGDADKGTILYQLRPADGASYSFLGVHNSASGVGVLNPDGSMRWFQRITYSPRAISSLPATSVVPRGLVVAGAHDTDGDGQSNVGYASLYSSTGNLLSQILVASDSSHIWFNDMVPVSDSTFVASGGERRSGVEHPCIVVLHLRAPGLLERGGTATLQGIPGLFGGIVSLPSSPTVLVLATLFNNGATNAIDELRVAWPGLDPVAVQWSHEITSPIGPVRRIGGPWQVGGNLYVTGAVADNRKTPDAGGGLWSSGLVASYTGSGDLRWSTIVSLSAKAEVLYDIAVGSDGVYAVGDGASFVYRNEEVFGYGLISKLDINTGQVLANFTLGNDRFASGFYATTWTTGGLVCGGFTEFEVRTGPYRGWFSTLDVSAATPVSRTQAPATARFDALDPGAASVLHRRDRDLR